ncbi:helix-turn-helix domain-containing protein [Rhodovulum sp. DZ06]|uniref:helix-turn-helix domain-containing protein n=1 Tax=Rhodovulum sp. DZ06 TaxID=3425126 RepID=UPI003D33DE18
MTRSQKLYAGVELREARRGAGLTQRAFAEALGISLSYLNQMENNHRPLSAAVVLALADRFGFDLSRLSVGESDRMVADMKEALADPVFAGAMPPVADLQLAASNAPALARAFLQLHRTWRQTNERLASLDAALGRGDDSLAPLPWEEVRDFFHYCDNYIDAVDKAAEGFAAQAGLADAGPGEDRTARLAAWLSARKGVEVALSADGPLRRFDGEVITLSARAPAPTRAFQLAHQVALLFHHELIEATLDLAGFRTEEAREICRIGLANYFAGAAIMPYAQFIDAADGERHDLEALSDRFGASLEQVGQRLSTLQRPGAKGVPFFFARVDQAGTVTKRHSATRLQFARYGGACPLWNVHQAFETPGRLLRQLAETPDGTRYISLAMDVSKPGGGFRAPTRRYAIALGCEIRHAGRLVYADDLDLTRDAAFEPIGVSCRICERRNCHQRSVPPLRAAIHVERDRRDVLPYALYDQGAISPDSD